MNRHAVKDQDTIVTIFSGTKRRGRWTPAGNIRCCHILGSGLLDLREAELPHPALSIDALCLLGSLTVVVPDDVGVYITGIQIFGGIKDATSNQKSPEAPDIGIRVISILGGVSVRNTILADKMPRALERLRSLWRQ